MGLFLLAPRADASGARVWGMDPEDLSTRLARSEYESLRHVSFIRNRLDDVERLGDDAAYALGLVYLELDIDEIGQRLLRLAWERSPEPWRSAALNELIAHLTERELFADLEVLAREAVDAGERDAPPPDDTRLAAELALLRALYHQRRFDELHERLLDVRDGLSDRLPQADARSAELALWWAITRVELAVDGWPEDIRALYLDYPASPVHSRVWVFLINRDELLASFSESDRMLFRAKQLLSEGRSVEAVRIMAEIAGETPEVLLTGWGVSDLYSAGVRSGRMSVAATALASLAAADAGGRHEASALELAGRLYRLAGAYHAAIPLLEESLALVPPGAREQRIRWYLLSSRVRQDPVGAATDLAAVVPSLAEPSYFSDLFDELAGLLAERERWDGLLSVYQAISDFAAPGALARYELALARALETGRLAAAPGRAEELRRRYLERAASQRENLFAALVAATLLGEDTVPLLGIAGGDEQGPGDAGQEPADTTSADGRLALTFFRYGLLDRLAPIVRSGSGIDPGFRVQASARLARAGRFRESVMALTPLERTGGVFTDEAARLRYPRAFAAIVDARADEEAIDASTFYALLREESLFDPEIGSIAGAIGLAQLIPATAADIARRMRLDDPVLTDPADNVAIGARYFRMLTDQFGTMSRSLAAYNAGQGNVRSWERRWTGLDEVLFHQVMPFAETYNHVRKVVVSGSYYGYLYAGRPPAETVRLIFALD